MSIFSVKPKSAPKTPVFDVSKKPMLLIDENGIILSINPAGQAFFGQYAEVFKGADAAFQPDSLVGSSLASLCGSDKDVAQQPSGNAIELQVAVGSDFFNLNFSPLKDRNGNVQQTVVEWAAITEDLNAKAFINALNTSHAVIEFGLDGTVQEANQNFLTATGYSRDEVIGRHHRMFCEPEFASSSEYQMFWSDLDRGEPQSGKFKRVNKFGDPLWFEATYTPAFGPDGKVYRVVKFASDITKEELTRQESERELSSMRGAIDRSQATIEFDLDGVIETANKNFLDTVGYSLSDIVGKHHRMFCEPELATSAEYAQFWADLKRGEFKNGTFKRVGNGGKEIWLGSSYTPMFDSEGKPYKIIKFATDMTNEEIARVEAEAVVVEKAESQKQVVDVLASALKGLSEGELTQRIADDFPEQYQKLKEDYNSAIDTLGGTMVKVQGTTTTIHSGASDLTTATDKLSKRTEEQAASLEETAAALDEVTATVKQTAFSADGARESMKSAREGAQVGEQVVQETVQAMSAIKDSSDQISQIIGVIDEIAFQTNLLALNAGVEAARAGEAGRGFAVVASEVRALAQRSSDAAKDIKELISTSASHVQTGVNLVDKTGKALEEILTQVANVDSLVSGIAASASEQATALSEVNRSVNDMDQMTQKNAAMVEETTAACHSLSSDSAILRTLISHFTLGAEHAQTSPSPARIVAPVEEAVEEVAMFCSKARGNGAAVAAQLDDNWADF